MFQGANNELGMGVSFYLRNEFSNSANEIQRDFEQLSGVTEEATNRITSSISKMKMGFVSLAIGGAMLLPFMSGIQLSNDLEDSLADVRKTTGMLESEVLDLKDAFFAEDTRTGIFQMIDIAKIGGQIGVAKNEILGFTQSVDKMVVALGDEFSGGAEEVTKTVGVLRNILTDVKTDDVATDLLHLGNVLNELGAAGFATGPVVSDFASRIGAAAVPMGISSSKIFGLSATLQELGVNAERGGTAMQRFFMRMASNSSDFASMAGMSSEAFKKLVNEDSFGAFERVLESTKGMDNIALSEYLNKLNLDGAGLTEVFMKLRKSTDMLHEKMALSASAIQGVDSIMAEYNIKNETANASVEKMQKKFHELSVTLSDVIKVAFKPIVNFLFWMADGINSILKTKIGQFFAGLTVVIGGALVVFGLFNIAVGLAGFLSGKLALSLASLGMTEVATTFATAGLTAGMYALAGAVWTALAPLMPFILTGVAIVGVVWLLVEAWDSFQDVLDGTAEPADGFLGWLQRVGGVMQGVYEIFSSWNGQTFELSENMKNSLENMGLLELVLNIGTWVVRIIEFFKGFAGPVLETFNMLWDSVSKLASIIGNELNKMFNFLGIEISGAESSMTSWMRAGKYLAEALMMPFKAIALVLEGISWLITTITEAYEYFMGLIDSSTDFISGAFTFVKEIITGGDSGEINTDRISPIENRGMETAAANNANRFAPQQFTNNQASQSSNPAKVNNNINVMIDGQQLTAYVKEQQELESNRR